MAGLHADGNRSIGRLHHLVCWRLLEKGRNQLLNTHWRLSTSWMYTMNRRTRFTFHFSLFIFLFASACTPKPPEQQFIDDAMNAVGGRERIQQVKTIAIEGSGVNYNLGQDMKPEASTQQFAISGYLRKIDVENGRQRVEQTRTPKFPYFQGQQPQTQVLSIDGDVAFNETANG